jgi:H+-translocating NAD(P) transhydrogenase subunit beta
MIPQGLVQLIYLLAAALFIIGLKRLQSPATARHGNAISGIGMLLAIVVTLFDRAILSYGTIAAGMLVGTVLGVWMARAVRMTAMPQMVAILNGFGGGASLLVGGAEFLRAELGGTVLAADAGITIQLAVLIGAVTFTGSGIAFAKLQEVMTGRPISFPGMKVVSALVLAGILGLSIYQVVTPEPHLWPFYTVVGLSLLLGILLVIPIGGADMPVVIALLNSYSGVAAAMTGFVIGNYVLIISGALVGSSGLILTRIMCRAMNRSLANVLFGAFGAGGGSGAGRRSAEGLVVRQIVAEDAALQLAYARSVIVVPGYGLAVAQAQHTLREVAEMIERNGGEVRYAIHPVAGRMPGHMSVLLAESDTPYDRLITEVDDANDALARADIALVIGANDIVNTDARDEPSSPLYGMPIIEVDRARLTIVMKRSMAAGFAGVENPLFYHEKTVMLFGDAKKTLTELVNEIKLEAGAAV